MGATAPIEVPRDAKGRVLKGAKLAKHRKPKSEYRINAAHLDPKLVPTWLVEPLRHAPTNAARYAEEANALGSPTLRAMCVTQANVTAIVDGLAARVAQGEADVLPLLGSYVDRQRVGFIAIRVEAREAEKRRASAPIEIPADAVRRLREHQAKRAAGAHVLHDGEERADDTLDEQPDADDRKPVFDRDAPDADGETPEASVADAAAQRGQDHPPRNAPRPSHAQEPQPGASTRPSASYEREEQGIAGIAPARAPLPRNPPPPPWHPPPGQTQILPQWAQGIQPLPPQAYDPRAQHLPPPVAQPIDPHAEFQRQHEEQMRERAEARRRDREGKR
jgi:hypothetical protein